MTTHHNLILPTPYTRTVPLPPLEVGKRLEALKLNSSFFSFRRLSRSVTTSSSGFSVRVKAGPVLSVAAVGKLQGTSRETQLDGVVGFGGLYFILRVIETVGLLAVALFVLVFFPMRGMVVGMFVMLPAIAGALAWLWVTIWMDRRDLLAALEEALGE